MPQKQKVLLCRVAAKACEDISAESIGKIPSCKAGRLPGWKCVGKALARAPERK
jgi:hypothetical protein